MCCVVCASSCNGPSRRPSCGTASGERGDPNSRNTVDPFEVVATGSETDRQWSPNWVQTSHLRSSGVEAQAIREAPKKISIPHSVKARSAFDRCQRELA